jgi:putative peptide zinc metalloprotease protein
MLCPNCRRQVTRGTAYCMVCGRSLNGTSAVFDLVLGDRSRIAVVGGLTLGRASSNAVQFADPSVSRQHAQITIDDVDGSAPMLEDRGSSHGTWLDGGQLQGARALHDGSRIRLGNQELRVERRRSDAEPGRTIVVPPGASLVVTAAGMQAHVETAATRFGLRPRLRSGYALKRLAASEGTQRWALKNLANEQFVQFSDQNAALLELVDGKHSLQELVTEAEQRFGDAGTARLAALLATLSEGGFLAGNGVDDEPADEPAPQRRRLFTPREKAWPGAGKFFERLYERGGWLLFTRPALVLAATLGVLGVAAFVALVVGQYGTPFVVAKKIGLGGLAFLIGRALVVAFHEAAHGLTMTSYGRTPGRAGVKVLLIFPYAFVDTTDMWFEPRRRRIAVSAAGPASDFTLGGVFSCCCLAMPAGTLRDILFQLAFAAYVGCIFNLSPLIDRDGYFILVDALGEPGLRTRAREYLRGRLGGRGAAPSKALARYTYLSLVWSAGSALFVGAMSLRYRGQLAALLPQPLTYMALALLWLVILLPTLAMVVPPLLERARWRNA